MMIVSPSQNNIRVINKSFIRQINTIKWKVVHQCFLLSDGHSERWARSRRTLPRFESSYTDLCSSYTVSASCLRNRSTGSILMKLCQITWDLIYLDTTVINIFVHELHEMFPVGRIIRSSSGRDEGAFRVDHELTVGEGAANKRAILWSALPAFNRTDVVSFVKRQ